MDRTDQADPADDCIERRESILLRLLQQQRHIADPGTMMRSASEAVGRYLGADRTGFYELRDDMLDFRQGWSNGRLPLLKLGFPAIDIGARYLEAVRAGGTISIGDTRTDPLTVESIFADIGTVALIGAPIIRAGRWVAGLYVNHREVRRWNDEEVSFVRDVADYTWDAIERARAVTSLRESESRFRFLSELDQATRARTDPHEITETAARMLREHLSANRCAYADVEEDQDTFNLSGDSNHGVESIIGRYTFTQFGAEALRLMRSGQAYVVNDSETDPRTASVLDSYRLTRIRSVICIPVLKAGRFVAAMAVHQITPREWRQEEIDLVNSVASRCWESIARARVVDELREREKRFRFLAESIPQMVWTATPDGLLDYVNERGADYFGIPEQRLLGAGWLAWVHPEDRDRAADRWKHSLATGESYETAFRLRRGGDGSWRWHLVRAQLLAGVDGAAQQWFGTCTDIEDQKRAETELVQQWHTFDTVLSHTPDFAYTFDLEGRFTYINRALLALWQKSFDEARGKNFFELEYPPELARRLQHQIQRVIQTREPLRDRTPFTGASGETRFYEYIFVPVCDAEGSVEAVAGSTRDITEQARAEQLVQDDRRRWRELLSQSPAAIAVLRGPEHRFEWVNPNYAHHVGRTPEAVLGRTVSEALPEIEGQIYLDLLNEVYTTGKSFMGHESRIQLDRGDGTLADTYVNFVYAATRNVQGEIDGIFVHVTDVTDLVSARKRVEESEQRFRQAIDSMPQLVWSTRPDGANDLSNKQWLDYTGLSEGAAVADGWKATVHPEDQQAVLESWNHSLKSGEPYEIEYRCRRFDGQYRWFLARARPIRDEKGDIVRWFGTSTDIEDRRKAELAILTKQKLESLGLLAGGIAHDFNNLLVGVLGGASYAAEALDPAHHLQPILEGIVSAAERAAHLTRQMLAYAGKGRFLIERIDIGELIRSTFDLIKASIPRHVQLTLDTGDDHSAVEGDSGQMQQIVMNLILNAAESIEATKKGTVAVKTRVVSMDGAEIAAIEFLSGSLAPGSYLIFEVRDNGIGMNAETKAKIFDPFFTTKFTGRGLGLSAVQGILRAHKGALQLDTATGLGSTFRVFLPASGKASPNLPALDQTAPHRPGTILVIDDDEFVRQISKASLEYAGFEVLLAESGEQGLSSLLKEGSPPVSLIILDMSMPVLSGREVLQDIRRRGIDLPVLISSGYNEAEVYREFAGLDIAGFLQKPFTARQLSVRVRDVLQAERREGN